MSKIPLPHDFIQTIVNEKFMPANLLVALEQDAPTSIRLHPMKGQDIYKNERKVEWNEEGRYLPERPVFTLDPAFHQAAYYPQEAGSMAIGTILKQLQLPENPVVLDLCAAPGGKSTLLASYLNHSGLLVSNEINHSRAKVLKENLEKWGYINTIVTNNQPRDFQPLEDFFDLLLIDAPCSGEGMFRKDENARSEWSLEAVQHCASRQREIMEDIWETAKPGAYIIYSTCTFNKFENEENIKWMVDEFGASLPTITLNQQWKAGRDGIGFYVLPGTAESEGFFCCLLRKPLELGNSKIKWKQNKEVLPFKNIHLLDTFIGPVENHSLFQWRNFLFLFPSEFEKEFLHIQSILHVLKWGLEIGSIQAKGVIPSELLAYTFHLPLLFPKIELQKDQALSYLHGDTFKIDGPIGYVMFTYQNHPLGLIKNLGNRFNNLYPKNYRIRMKIN